MMTMQNAQNAGGRVFDKRKNWEARVEMAVLKLPGSELSTYDKMVYTVLCGHANREGNATLYVKTIAGEASCSERQAQRALAKLELCHLLARRPQIVNGRQTFNAYEVYGFDSYVRASGSEPDFPTGQPAPASHAVPVTHPCPPDAPGVTDSRAVDVSQAPLNNVFQQPLKNSSKENSSPPTPQGAGEGDGGAQNSKLQNSKPQEPQNDTGQKDGSAEPTVSSPESVHAAVVAAYNATLPELPRAEVFTASRSQTLNLRIGEDSARQDPEWWKRYFERVRLFPWLMGNNPNNWRASFDWLISEDGMRKVLEGSFSQAPRPAQSNSSDEFREFQKRYTDERGVVDAKALLRDWRARAEGMR